MRASPDFFAIGTRAIPTVISLFKIWLEIYHLVKEEKQTRVKAISTLKTASMSKSMNSNDI